MIRLTQIDGKLPNLALMKIARHHRDAGDEVVFTKRVTRDMLEPRYSKVYGSAIFAHSAARIAMFRDEFPDAVVGGTWNILDNTTVEQALGWRGDTSNMAENELYDYSIYPDFDGSIGFTQRGCRLKCGFCVVPKKEGKPRAVNTIRSLWRGDPFPRHLHLLDNDFFGQPREQWEARMIDPDAAKALASITLRDDQFKTRRLYTAWDNVGDEARFFAGVRTLEEAGVPPTCLLV